MELLKKSKEELNEIIDSGMFNSIIRGYNLLLLDQLEIDYDEHNVNVIMSEILDFKSADEARKRYENL